MSRAETTSSPTPAPRTSRWRKARRILLSLLIVLALLVIAVQVVLWSDLPRTLILSGLQKSLGLKAEAGKVSAGWFGRHDVTDAKLTVPLDDGPIVETRRIDVETNSLLMMLISGVEIRSVRIADPIVNLRQSSSGRWNVQDLLSQLGGGGSSSTAPPQQQGKPARPDLPAIDIHNATVRVTDRTGRKSQVKQASIVGTPDAAAPLLVWNFDVAVPGQLHIAGRVATGGEWRNEAKIDIQDLRPLLTPFVGEVPDIQLAAKWEGRSADGLHGRLAIDRAAVNGIPARGVVSVGETGGKIILEPQGLELFPDANQKPQLIATGGAILLEGGQIRAENLLLRGGGGVAAVNGQFLPSAKSGTVTANWTSLSFPAGLVHTGKANLKLDRTLDGKIDLTGQVDTQGQLVGNTDRAWDAKLLLRAAGPAFDNLSIDVDFSRLSIRSARQSVPLDGLAFKVGLTPKLETGPGAGGKLLAPGPAVVLQSVRLADSGRIAGAGYYLLKSGLWDLKLSGSRWPLPYLDGEALAVTIDAAGTPDSTSLHTLRVAAAETIFTATGGYVYRQPKPLDLVVTLEHAPPITAQQASAMGAKPVSPQPLMGELAGRGSMVGTLSPLNIEMKGELQGLHMRALDREIGVVSMKVVGDANPERAFLKRDQSSPPVMILGGKWDFEAVHSFGERASTLTVGVHEWDLREVGAFLKQPGFNGAADGSWTFYAPMSGDVPRDLRASGGLNVRGLHVASLDIDTLIIPMGIEKGRLTVGPIEARRMEGLANATASFAIDSPKVIEISNVKLDRWPVQLPPATHMSVSGSSPRVVVLLPDKSSSDPLAQRVRLDTGPMVVTSTLRVSDIDAGTAQLNLNVTGRVIHVPLLTAKIFDSNIEGQATLDLDSPNSASATLNILKIDPERMMRLAPSLRGLKGTFDLYCVMTPEINPNGLEPLIADISMVSRGLLYRNTPATAPTTLASKGPSSSTQPAPTPLLGAAPVAASTLVTSSPGVQVGNGRFRMMMRLNNAFQMERAVMEDQSGLAKPVPGVRPPKRVGTLPPNTLELAGGEVLFWGRIVKNVNDRGRQGFDTLSSHLRLGFNFLDLNQIMQASNPDGRPTPGDLSGEIILFGTTRLDEAIAAAITDEVPGDQSLMAKTIRSLQGSGTMKLTNSDLAKLTVIDFLYNAMHLGQGPRGPTGTGDGTFRIEGGSLYLTSFHYFNRGIEVRGVGTVDELYRFREATVHATLFGSVRTLRDIRLPLLQSVIPDLDQILSAIQTSGTSIYVTGTVMKPVPKVILFEELGRSMRELLLGDYKDANRDVPRQ